MLLQWVVLTPFTMIGTTCHRKGIVSPWRQVACLSPAKLVKQAAFASFGAIPLLSFQKSFPAQVVDSTADGGLGELQLSGDGGDGWPALTVLISTVGEVDIHRDCPMGQVTAIEEVKSAQWTAPPVSSRGCFVCWAARDAWQHRRLACRRIAWAVFAGIPGSAPEELLHRVE